MYRKFFGLKTLPFNITCDPQFYFESASHREAYAALLYGIKEKKGIILLTGEVGTGKTTLCRTLLSNIEEKIKVSLILNPVFSDVQLLQAIVEDFGLHLEKKSRLDIVNRLNDFLIDLSMKGGTAVLIIDEAQDLTIRQLEQIRLLSNLETSQDKLLQIVLVGQPELLEKLKEYRLRQIRQRIFIKYHLEPLRKDEIEEYVQMRLNKSGRNNITITPECYKVIYGFSKGIPRLVNILCDRTLLIGYVEERIVFDAEIFKNSMKELL